MYYCLGLAPNSRWVEAWQPARAAARARRCLTGAARARACTEFEYETRTSWRRARRVMGQTEVMAAGDHPRFLVTNLPARGFRADADRPRFTPPRLDEEFYGGRGEMENVRQQPTLDLAADRLSTHYLASHPRRLWRATGAYLLLERGRSWGRAGPELARATAGSGRLKLLQVAAQVTVSVRRVSVRLSRADPWQGLLRWCQQRLQAPASGCGRRAPTAPRLHGHRSTP